MGQGRSAAAHRRTSTACPGAARIGAPRRFRASPRHWFGWPSFEEEQQMPRLVTAVFYGRQEAENAIGALRQQGMVTENIYLEREVEPGADMGHKGGEVSSLETERRFAGLESGASTGIIL